MVPWSDCTKSVQGLSDTVIEHQRLLLGDQCSELGELRVLAVSTVLVANGARMADATFGGVGWYHGVTLEGVHAREKA